MVFPPEPYKLRKKPWTLKDYLLHKQRVLADPKKVEEVLPEFYKFYGKKDNVYLLQSGLYKIIDDVFAVYFIDFNENTLNVWVLDRRKKFQNIQISNKIDISYLKYWKDWDEFIHRPDIRYMLTVNDGDLEKIEL